MHIYIYIYIYIHTYIHIHIHTSLYIYMHTPAVAHDMHKDHPLKLRVEEHLPHMHLNRRRLLAYLPIGFRIPLQMHHCLQLPWQPLFAMQALFALPASQKIAVRNRSCRCVPFSETRAEIKRSFFLAIRASIIRNLCSTTGQKHVMSLNTKFRYHVAATHRGSYKHAPYTGRR